MSVIRPTPARLAALVAAAAGLALAAPALAQNKPDATPTEPALKGPSVTERDVPGVRSRFGESPEAKKTTPEDRIPPRVFRDALEDALGEDAPEAVRASPAQRDAVEDLVIEHERKVRAYMREHRDEIQAFRAQGPGRRGRPGGGPDGMLPPPPPPGMEGDDMMSRPLPPPPPPDGAPRQRARELLEGAPPASDLFTKVWAELRPEQRTAVEARLDEFRERASKARQEQYVDRKIGKRAAGAADVEGAPPPPPRDGPRRRRLEAPRPGDDLPPPPPGARAPRERGPAGERPDRGGDGNARISPERRDRLLRLFSQLPPEAQDRALDRMEQRMRDEGRGRGRRPEGAPKPPPPMDEVEVPDAESSFDAPMDAPPPGRD